MPEAMPVGVIGHADDEAMVEFPEAAEELPAALVAFDLDGHTEPNMLL